MPNENVLKAISWTLIHSVWQGLVLAIFAGLVIVFTKKSKAALRYNWLSGLFITFMAGVGFTFNYEYQQETTVYGNAIIAKTLEPETMSAGTAVNTLDYFQVAVGYINEYASTIVVIWFLIFMLKSFGIFRSLSNIYKIRNYKTQEAPEYWNSRIAELCEQLNIKKHITLLESRLVQVPSVTGFFKPIILIPVGLLSNLPQDQIEAILLHELAHIRRKDYFINLLQSFAEILFFFNPGLLWISSLIKEERENCCDDIAVGITRSKSNFIHALVSFQEYNMKQNQLALGFGKNKNQLLERARRIVQDNNKSLNTIEKTFLSLCIVVIITFSLACSNTKATVVKTPQKGNNTEIAYLKNLSKDKLLTEEEISEVEIQALSAQKEATIANVEAEDAKIEAQAALLEAQQAQQESKLSEAEIKKIHYEAVQAQIESEKARKESEIARIESDKARKESDKARKESEIARIDSEKARKESELARKEDELARKEREKARKESEKERLEADKYKNTTGATFQVVRPMTFTQAQASGVCVMPNATVTPIAKPEPVALNYAISRNDALNSRIQANNERVNSKIKANEKRIAANVEILAKKDAMNSKKQMWLVNQKNNFKLKKAEMFEIKRAKLQEYNLQKLRYSQDSLYKSSKEVKDKKTGSIVIPNDTDDVSREIIHVLAKEKAIASMDNLSYKLSHDSIIVNGKRITGNVHDQLEKYLKPNMSAIYYNYDITAQDLAEARRLKGRRS